MLLTNYRLEIFKSKCQSSAMGVHCFAHLDQDVSCTRPYLNTVLGGFEYLSDPPAVTFRAQGKLITVHATKIAVNAMNPPVWSLRQKLPKDLRGPELDQTSTTNLADYMSRFNLDV